MDGRQDTLYGQPVWESDRTDVHNIGGNGLPEPRLPTSMSFRVSASPVELYRTPVLYSL